MLSYGVQFVYRCPRFKEQIRQLLFVSEGDVFTRRNEQGGAASRDEAEYERPFVGVSDQVDNGPGSGHAVFIRHRVACFVRSDFCEPV